MYIMYKCIHIHTYIYIHIYMYIYVHICTYMHTYKCINSTIHTHIRTFMRPHMFRLAGSLLGGTLATPAVPVAHLVGAYMHPQHTHIHFVSVFIPSADQPRHHQRQQLYKLSKHMLHGNAQNHVTRINRPIDELCPYVPSQLASLGGKWIRVWHCSIIKKASSSKQTFHDIVKRWGAQSTHFVR